LLVGATTAIAQRNGNLQITQLYVGNPSGGRSTHLFPTLSFLNGQCEEFETGHRCGAYERYMTNNFMLRSTSVLLLLLLTLHVVDDIVHGFDSAGLINMIGIVALGLLIYGTLVLHERVSGHIVMLFAALFSALMPVIHLRSARINETAQASGGSFLSGRSGPWAASASSV